MYRARQPPPGNELDLMAGCLMLSVVLLAGLLFWAVLIWVIVEVAGLL